MEHSKPGRYRRYEKYEPSAASWQGLVPEHWQPTRFKHVLLDKKKTSNPSLVAGSISFGRVVFKDRENLSQETKDSYQEVLAGEYLVNPLNLNYDLLSLRTAMSEIDVVVSTGYIVLKSSGKLRPRYIRWLLHEFDVSHMKTLGAGVRQTINYSDIGNSYFCEPTDAEQDAIANFLDYETAKIDALIEKQQRLIELLKEKRQAVISHAVTKGLNPNAPMKDSGVEWLGEVPAHWIVLQLRRVLTGMEQGKSPECESRPADLNEWGVLKTGCVNNGAFNFNENKFLPEHIVPFSQFEVKNGDVLMSRASGSVDLIGSVAYVNNPREKLLLSDKIFRLRFEPSVHKIFFTRLMQSSYMRSNIKVEISGAEGMANNITKSSINSFRFALPPFEEQVSIAQTIEKKVSTLDRLIQRSVSGIDLLQERRTALISATVTGKIDVRDWQAAA